MLRRAGVDLYRDQPPKPLGFVCSRLQAPYDRAFKFSPKDYNAAIAKSTYSPEQHLHTVSTGRSHQNLRLEPAIFRQNIHQQPLALSPTLQILHNRLSPSSRDHPDLTESRQSRESALKRRRQTHHILVAVILLLMLAPRWDQRPVTRLQILLRLAAVTDDAAVALDRVDDGVFAAVVVNGAGGMGVGDHDCDRSLNEGWIRGCVGVTASGKEMRLVTAGLDTYRYRTAGRRDC